MNLDMTEVNKRKYDTSSPAASTKIWPECDPLDARANNVALQ
jgi:hypothetical protein